MSASAPIREAGLPPLACHVEGSGPSLVLCHGGMGSHTHWQRNLAALSARFRVRAFDLPGFGDSPDVPDHVDPEGYLDWVGAEAAALPGPIHLVGFSFGGAVAAAVAARLGPRIAALTLLGPGGFGNPVGRSISLQSMPRGGSEAQRRKVIAHNLSRWMLARTPDPDDPVVDIQQRNIARARFDSRRISLQDNLPGNLARLACPVQIIWGADDPLAYPSIEERQQRCRAARRDIAFHTIPGAGHWVQYEAATAVNALLISFHAKENGA